MALAVHGHVEHNAILLYNDEYEPRYIVTYIHVCNVTYNRHLGVNARDKSHTTILTRYSEVNPIRVPINRALRRGRRALRQHRVYPDRNRENRDQQEGVLVTAWKHINLCSTRLLYPDREENNDPTGRSRRLRHKNVGCPVRLGLEHQL
jgi:hypothetical protein